MARQNFQAPSRAEPGTSVAVSGSGNLEIGGIALKIKKKVAMPTLRQRGPGSVAAFIVNAPMFISTRDVKIAGQAQANRAVLVNVTDLTDGVEKQYVVPTILRSEWEPTLDPNTLKPLADGTADPGPYSNGAYVGLAFAIRKRGKSEGKNYNDLDIAEIDADDFLKKIEEATANAAKPVNE